MQDIDDFDPLDDILLSDEEIHNKSTSKNVSSIPSKPKEILQFDEESKEEKKKRMLAELFGSVEEEKEEPRKEISNSNKSNWLDLKVENEKKFKKHEQSDTLIVDKFIVEEEENPSANHKSPVYSLFEVKQKENIHELRNADRRKSETNASLNLKKSKQRFKSLDLDLDLDFDEGRDAENLTLKSTTESTKKVIFETAEENKNESSYVPSSGVNRRFGFSKRRPQSTEKTILFVASDHLPKLDNTETFKDTLPSWLEPEKSTAGDNFHAFKSETSKTAVSEKRKQNISEEENNFDHLEKRLSTVMELKKKQEELKSTAKFQSENLMKHEKEIQDSAIKLMQQHRNNISALMQIVSFDDTIHKNQSYDENIENKIQKSEILISQLRLKLIEQELEKSEIELKLKHFESKYNVDMATAEDLFRYKLEMAEEKESYLRREIQILEDEYNSKIQRQKINEDEIIRSYKKKIRLMQEEHLNEIKYIVEYHGLKYGIHVKNEQPTKDASIKEIALEDKQRELLEYEQHLNGQKVTLEGKIAAFETRVGDFETKMAKEKIFLDQLKKDLKLAQNIFEEKETSWKRESQREKEYLHNYKQELESVKENLLKEEKKLMKEKFELSTEKVRLEAIMNSDGLSRSMGDILQNKADLQVQLDESNHLKTILENEREELKNKERQLKEENWKLKDIEQQLVLQNRHVQKLLRESEMKKEEGIKALRKAQRIENQMNVRMEEIEQRLTELNTKEERLTEEKIQISKDRETLNRQRHQLDQILPQLTYEEQLPFNILNKRIINPEIMFMKLKAENDLDILFGR